MICPNCGAAVGNDVKFCNCCGSPMPQQQPQYQPPQYQAPQYQPYQSPQYQPSQYQPSQYEAYRVPAKPMTKKEFLKNPPQKVKTKSVVTLVTLILSIVLIIFSAVMPIFRPLFRIPSLSLVLALADVDTSELTREIETMYEELADDFELSKHNMDEEEIELAEKILRSAKKLTGSFTMLDLAKLARELRDDFGVYLEDYFTYQEMQLLDAISMLPVYAIVVTCCSFLLPLILALLAGLKKSMGLSIAALIFTLIPQVIFNGTMFVTLTLAVFITQAVLCSQMDKDYKNYQMGIL